MVSIKFEKLKTKLADSTDLNVSAEGHKVVFSVNFPGNPDADRFVQELNQEEKPEATQNPESPHTEEAAEDKTEAEEPQ